MILRVRSVFGGRVAYFKCYRDWPCRMSGTRFRFVLGLIQAGWVCFYKGFKGLRGQ